MRSASPASSQVRGIWRALATLLGCARLRPLELDSWEWFFSVEVPPFGWLLEVVSALVGDRFLRGIGGLRVPLVEASTMAVEERFLGECFSFGGSDVGSDVMGLFPSVGVEGTWGVEGTRAVSAG